jgi:hypothetical protein
MRQAEKKLAIVWEEVHAPDAAQRVSAAFAMLLGPVASQSPDEGLDNDDRPAKINSKDTHRQQASSP